MPQANDDHWRWASGAAVGPAAFVGALALAALQTVRAWRLGTPDHAVTLTVAWAVVLALVWRRPPPESAHGDRRPDPLARGIGVATALGIGAAAVLTPTYRMADRALPAVVGAALALAAYGWRGIAVYRREILLLALPLINPMPRALRETLAPTTWTAWSAAELQRAVGHEMTASGNVVHTAAGSTLEVAPYCAGVMSMSELWVLALILMALFPTTAWQRLALFGSATILGFACNAVRIAVLAGALARGEPAYDYWHAGAGSTFFSLGATALAGALWWRMLRPSPGPSPTPLDHGRREAALK
ncbi:MAG TPA: exosortase/archaeosortase family protein [Polyangiaceae bacterium]|nr:exosortase/archaeosortase family protein [Polyangiaceae bacterium]